MGMCSDEMRLPMVPMTDKEKEPVRKMLKDYGLLES
jgi:dihydrodipicolinate synthase/N-acetylneuraminate lyase